MVIRCIFSIHPIFLYVHKLSFLLLSVSNLLSMLRMTMGANSKSVFMFALNPNASLDA